LAGKYVSPTRYAGNIIVRVPGVVAGPVPATLTYERQAEGLNCARYLAIQLS
jgi:hypothetical protein